MKKTIFIGQAMPRAKTDPHDWPSLNKWLYSIGVDHNQLRQHFFYSALVDYFPGAKGGSHLVPTKEMIKKERPRLIKTIRDFGPELVVPIGKLSISYCLEQELVPLSTIIGCVFYSDPYNALGYKVPIVPLPHPSGASTWRHRPENRELLLQALAELNKLLYTGE